MLSQGSPVNPGELAISSRHCALVPRIRSGTGSVGQEGRAHRSEHTLIEVSRRQGQPEAAVTDSSVVLRTHTTCEGGEPQGSRKGGQDTHWREGGTDGRSDVMAHSRDIELGDECPTPLGRLTELAKEDPVRRFYSIAQFLTRRALYEAFKRLRKDASAGVDGVTFQEYQKELGRNLQNLYERVKSGQYRAQPLRRVYIPKESGKSERPISIPLWKIRSYKLQRCGYSTPSMRRIFWTALMDHGRDGTYTRLWMRSIAFFSANRSHTC